MGQPPRHRRKLESRRNWMPRAYRAFVEAGGIETVENSLRLTLLLLDYFERGMNSTVAGVEAAERYHEGELAPKVRA